ncbi:MAG: cytochrome c [Anaerolineales bacterium]|nr:cytochrome c [Anaerolineales bacterium]MCB9145507.1 cytochrome c [Anaerolineales bacterium]
MRNKLFILLIAAVLFLSACSSTPTVAPMPTLDPIAKQGQAVFNARCATCHALVPDTIIIGPSLYGIATRAETRVEGQTAEEYITMSILRPGDYVVEGFNNVMITNLAKEITSEEMNSLVAFLLTLK